MPYSRVVDIDSFQADAIVKLFSIALPVMFMFHFHFSFQLLYCVCVCVCVLKVHINDLVL